jgi:peptidase E
MRQIVTLGGGFLPDGRGGYRPGALLGFLLALAPPEPRVCLLNTATGDDPRYYTALYAALATVGARVSHLALFPMPSREPGPAIEEADVVLVGGGSVANLAAVWRVHGLDVMFRAAWERGTVLSGSSAGAICWHVGGTTDSFGPDLRCFTEGLGLLPHSHCPHYDSEPRRRPAFQELVGEGSLPAGWAADDGVALHFVDEELVDVVAERPDARAFRVEAAGGRAVETEIVPRLLAPPTFTDPSRTA